MSKEPAPIRLWECGALVLLLVATSFVGIAIATATDKTWLWPITQVVLVLTVLIPYGKWQRGRAQRPG